MKFIRKTRSQIQSAALLRKPTRRAAIAKMEPLEGRMFLSGSLLVDGGFESAPGDETTLPGWTIFGPGHQAGTGGINVLVGPSPYVLEGNQSIDLIGESGQGTGIEQSFATQVGATYTLSFKYVHNTNSGAISSTAEVSVLGKTSRLDQTFTHTGDASNVGLFSKTFVADSTQTLLRFTSLSTNGGFSDSESVILDAVSVTTTAPVLGSISGTVYFDTNKNGVDDGDPGLSGAKVYIDANNNKALDAGEIVSALTGADGKYTLTGLAAGTYTVRVIPPVGYAPRSVGADSTTVNLLAGQTSVSNNLGEVKASSTVTLTGNNVVIPFGDLITRSTDNTSFGTVVVGKSADKKFTLTNSGSAPLILGPTSVSLVGGSEFTVLNQPVGPLAPGASTTFTIEYSPALSGSNFSTVNIASNDPAHPKFSFTVGGIGTGFGFGIALGAAGSDNGKAVSTDAAGNVYVAGSFQGSVDFDPSSLNAFLTGPVIGRDAPTDGFIAKYTPAGAFVWVKQVKGGSVNGLAVDKAGNVYATGGLFGKSSIGTTVENAGTHGTGFVAKLSSGGSVAWVSLFGNGGTGPGGTLANALGLDATGNIYAGGVFTGPVNFGTTSLTSAGYIAGSNNNSSDVFVVKLGSSGQLVFVKQFGGVLPETLGHLAVNAGGTFAIEGLFENKVDFNPGPGTAYLTSATNPSGQDYNSYISIFNSDGTWRTARSLPAIAESRDVAIDNAGNVFVTGESYPLDHSIAFITKYNSSLVQVWSTSFGTASVAKSFSQGDCLTLGPQGDVYVGGYFDGTCAFGTTTLTTASTKPENVFISHFSSTGAIGRTYQLVSNGQYDDVTSIAYSATGALYSTGNFGFTSDGKGASADFNPGTGTDFIKSAGNLTNSVLSDAFLWKLDLPATASVSLSGTGGAAIANGQAAVASTGQDFGNLKKGLSKSTGFTIYNNGAGTLSILGISIAGTNAADFQLVPSTGSLILGKTSVGFSVIFKAGTLGVRTAVVSILTNDPLLPTYIFLIRGTSV